LGSMEFARQSFAPISDSGAVIYMFASAFVLFGFIPLMIIIFLFQDSWKNYGVTLGDWKRGILYISILLPVICIALLYPASHRGEIRAFYPLEKHIGESVSNFLALQIPRLVLFYTAWEFFFRGYMLFGVRKYVGDWLAICIQTIPSCLWHL